jgi:hypothetical protein
MQRQPYSRRKIALRPNAKKRAVPIFSGGAFLRGFSLLTEQIQAFPGAEFLYFRNYLIFCIKKIVNFM